MAEKLFDPRWLDKAIDDWERTAMLTNGEIDSCDEAWELGTDDGLCSYFQTEFDYPLCKIFTSLGYDKAAYVFPVIWLSARSWEEHALPRVEFLKNFKAELSKMGYK
jgi:hypothetical protein